ncbi:two-component sensor histidine kinase [Salipaludibacillus keqinensis]|uniref:histidine kinase n=1 Tax=Salipaludibacillus keqinensis TaxID=2045207 RepID=A0A323TF81_9BACI|nr:ATP-binding protein [Salipaludibacillus keqinensis]PYZ92674.1 two-component sensor histidine kinase [Salipaludibacillus keqinensis]
MTETLLINFLFLLFPVVTYLIFFENKFVFTKHKTYVVLLSAISMVLCMTFPIQLDIGSIFDLRYVPFTVASLFGGYIVALPLYVVLNIYRFFLGGEGVLFSFYFSTVIFLLVPLLSKTFIQQKSRKRIVIAGIVSFITMVLYLATIAPFYPPTEREFWLIAGNVLTIHVVSSVIIMIVIEKIIDNVTTRERLFLSERLHVMSELSASVSHEIRNPLTVTNGFLQLLNRSTNIDEKEKGYIDLSLQELNRAERIVSDFLSLAKPQAENMVSSDLKTEVEYVNNIMVAYSNLHQVSLDFHFSNTLTKKFDQNQIQQCLINLYKNGIEAMKEHGGTLTVGISDDGKHIVITIKDTGVGMSKEEVLRMGNPYYSTKEAGTGLGMLMVFSTIDKMGGKIDVDSEKGVGTTFRITL